MASKNVFLIALLIGFGSWFLARNKTGATIIAPKPPPGPGPKLEPIPPDVIPPPDYSPVDDWMGNSYPSVEAMTNCVSTSGSPDALLQCSIASWAPYKR